MKKMLVVFAGLAWTLAALAGSHAFVEPADSDPLPYLWSYVGYWKTCNDYPNDVTKYRSNISLLGGPGDGKILHIDSDKLTPEHPLKIDDGRFVSVGQAYIGTFGGAPYGNEPHVAALEVGAGAVLVTASLDSYFGVGDREGSMGALILDSGSIVSNNKFRVGALGVGIVTNNGGRVWTAKNNNNYGIYIGYGATGVGHYVQNSGFSEFRICEIGTEGNGTLEFCGGAANVGTPTLGVKAGGRGTYIIHSGAAVTNGNTNVGSAENSSGTIDLRGGDYLCTGSATVRCKESAYGSICGWGKLYKPSATAASGEMNGFTMNGQVIADAQGIEGRFLDFSYARGGNDGKVNVKVTIPNGVTGTNGWFAVNKGIAILPLLHVVASEYIGTFGANTNEYCDLVNTVRIDYHQSANKGPWLEAQLYANDSSLVPAELPGKLIGAWGFRANVSYNDRGNQLANLTGFDLRFRYDHRGIDAGANLAVMRYSQSEGKWVKVRRFSHDPASPFVSVSGLTADGASYDRNLGIFAVTKQVPGFVVLVR